MSEIINLDLSKREAAVSEDSIAGIVYGNEAGNIKVEAPANVVLKAFKVAGTSQIINVSVGNEKHEVLLKDVQYHPVTNNLIHFDLYAIKRGQKIKAEVPVVLIGESPAVAKGLEVNQLISVLEVETIPSKIPSAIEVDISKLEEVNDTLSVKDLSLDQEVDVLADGEQALVKVDEVKELEVEDTTAAGDEAEGEEGSQDEEGVESTESEDSSSESSAEA